MKTYIFRCLLGFTALLMTSVSQSAVEFSSVSYDIYYFDANGDGVFDYVVSPKDSTVLLRSPLNLVFPRDVQGDFFIDGVDGNVFDYSLNPEKKRDLSVVDYEFHYGDFDGDGLQDLALKSNSNVHDSIVLFGAAESKTPKTARFINEISNQALAYGTFEVIDKNQDGTDELLVDLNGQKTLIAVGPVGFIYVEEPSVQSLSPETMNVSTVPGATKIDSSVSSQGVLHLSLPLTLPTGSGGLTPNLSLSYRSSGSNGVVGLGWSIDGMSSIHRCAKNKFWDGVDRIVSFSENDSLCIDGERMVLVSGGHMTSGAEYRARSASDTRIKIVQSGSAGPQRFKVWKKSGEIYTYGSTVNSRLQGSASGKNYQWNLSQVSDRSNNYYSYIYDQDPLTHENTLSSIEYSGNSDVGTLPTHEVEFEYINREAPIVSYTNGQRITRKKLLRKVSVNYGSTPVREYHLDYSTTSLLNIPKLAQVQECAGAAACFEPSKLEWHDDEQDYSGSMTQASQVALDEFAGESGWNNDQNATQVADLNSDGIPEIIGFKSDGLHIGFKEEGFGSYRVEAPVWASGPISRFADEEVDSPNSRTYRPIRRQLIDLNNDGLLDIFAQYYWLSASNNPVRKVFVSYNQGDSFGPVKDLGQQFGNNEGLFLPGDINNDGLVDLVKVMHHNGRAGNIITNKYYLGITPFFQEQDGTFSTHVSYSPIFGMEPFPTYIEWHIPKSEFNDLSENPVNLIDVNKDGFLDITLFQNSKFSVALGDGLNFGNVIDSGYAHVNDTMVPNSEHSFSVKQPQLSDLNSDGYPDLIGFKSDGIYVSINDGSQFTTQQRWAQSFGNTAWSLENDLRVITDINGDGFKDVIGANTNGINAALGNGNGFVDVSGGLSSQSFPGWTADKHSRVFADMNGDSFADFLGFGASQAIMATLSLKPTKVAKLTDGLGNEKVFEYAPLSDTSVYQADAANYSSDVLPFKGAYYVVSSLRTNDGIGGSTTSSYQYKGMQIHRYGLGSLGFREYSVLESNSGAVNTFTYSQNFSDLQHGLLLKHEVLVEDGNTGLAQKTTRTTDWSTNYISGSFGNPSFRYRTEKREELSKTSVRESAGSGFTELVRQQTTYSGYDEFGNVSTVVTSETDEFGTLTKTNNNVYSNNSSQWILGRLVSSEVTSSFEPGPSPHAQHLQPQLDKRKASFSYYPDTGYLRSETSESDKSNWVRETHLYDSFGQREKTIKDWSSAYQGLGFTSTEVNQEFDPTGRFVVRSYTPVTAGENSFVSSKHTSATTYDLATGLPQSKTDSNGRTITFEYDPFGRLLKKTQPDGNWKRTSREFCGTECPQFAVRKTVLEGSDGTWSVSYFDSFNRVVEERSLSLNGLQIGVQKQYDQQGRVLRVSEPFFVTQGPQHWVQTQYDGIGRVSGITSDFMPDATGGIVSVSKNMAYSGMATTVTNELGQVKTTWRNARDQAVKVIDDSGNAVSHRYDTNGNLIASLDSAGNTTTVNYDNFGRKISMDDPDKGHWEYEYNGLGLLYRQTDAKGQATELRYDKLGRKTERTDNAQLPVDHSDRVSTQWRYDNEFVGKLDEVSDGSFAEEYDYDEYGRVTDIRTQIGSESYVRANVYDSLGRLTTKIYPEGFSIDYQYNNFGYLHKVKNALSGETYWEAKLMDEHGNIAQYSVEGGAMTVNRIHDEVRGVLRRAEVTTIAGTPLQELSFGYDALSNLIRRDDHIAGAREEFEYDNINRLELAETYEVSSGETLINSIAVSYDGLGNILSKSDVGSYSVYGGSCDGVPAGPHAVTSIEGDKAASYCYDQNGNMVSGAGRTIEYSSFNKPSLIIKGQNRVEFRYGPSRSRYYRKDTTATGVTETTYLGGDYEKVVSGGLTKHKYYVGDSAIVTKEAGKADKVHYLFKDHLGSVNTVVDSTGNVVERRHFDPWGNRLAGDWVTTRDNNDWIGIGTITTKGFTGHEQLASVDLIHMNGRVYDPTIGRFIQADPIVQAPNDLQSLNRYSYVRNNPLSLTDPSGYSWFSDAWDSLKSFVKKWWRPIVSIAIMVAAPGIGHLIGSQLMGFTAAGMAAGYVSTGTLKGALIGGLSGAVFFGIGEAFAGMGQLTIGERFAKTWMHGMAGLGRASALGGDELGGFVSAGFSQAVSVSGGFEAVGLKNDQLFLNAAAAAVVGGTASRLAGAKFANGAITGAFSRLFNDLPHSQSNERAKGLHIGTKFEVSQRPESYSEPGEWKMLGAAGDLVAGLLGAVTKPLSFALSVVIDGADLLNVQYRNVRFGQREVTEIYGVDVLYEGYADDPQSWVEVPGTRSDPYLIDSTSRTVWEDVRTEFQGCLAGNFGCSR